MAAAWAPRVTCPAPTRKGARTAASPRSPILTATATCCKRSPRASRTGNDASPVAMSDVDTSPSGNGRLPDAWYASWIHLRVDRRSRGYCRVTFDHPPVNAITAITVEELAELVGLIDQDPDLNVVVFDSANPDFYLAQHGTDADPR